MYRTSLAAERAMWGFASLLPLWALLAALGAGLGGLTAGLGALALWGAGLSYAAAAVAGNLCPELEPADGSLYWPVTSRRARRA